MRRFGKDDRTGLASRKPAGCFRILLLIVCGAVLGVNVYLTNANRLVGNQLPMPFGCGAAVVLSGSMEPALFTGDLIIVREAACFSENDIVVFQDGNTLIVHRIIGINGESVTTKGDANDAADEPIDVSRLKGKVVFRIPFAGKMVSLIKTPVGTILVIMAAIALIEIPRRKEKRKDDEERQKIIDEIEQLKQKRND